MLLFPLSLLLLIQANKKPTVWSDRTDIMDTQYVIPGDIIGYNYPQDTSYDNKKEDPPISGSWFELLRVLTADWPENILKWTRKEGSGGNTFEIDIKDPLSKYPLGSFDISNKAINKRGLYSDENKKVRCNVVHKHIS